MISRVAEGELHDMSKLRRVGDFIEIRIAGAAIALLLASTLMACGGSSSDDSAEPKAGAGAPADVERRLTAIENQLLDLEKESRGMRSEVDSRLDGIDKAKEALFTEVAALRQDLTGEASEASAPVRTEASAASENAVAESSDAKEPRRNVFLRIVLLILIVVPIVFIARIFFGRWGPDAEDEGFALARPPRDEFSPAGRTDPASESDEIDPPTTPPADDST